MVRKSVRLGDKTFNSKGSAYDYVKMLLYNMILGGNVSGVDMLILEPLFRMHPSPGKLVGWDGQRATVVHDEYKKRSFALCMPDGTLRLIGARKCIYAGVENGPNSVVGLAAAEEAAWEAAGVAALVQYEASIR